MKCEKSCLFLQRNETVHWGDETGERKGEGWKVGVGGFGGGGGGIKGSTRLESGVRPTPTGSPDTRGS